MTRALLLLMTAAATCQGGTQSATFHSGGDLILVTNADKINFNGTSGTAPVRQASATGSPVQVVWVERGMTMHARSLDATWVEIDPVTTEFRRAQMQGDAMLVIDGAAAEKALAADAEANHKPVPPTESETTFQQLNSDVLSYSGNVERGTISIPGPWTYRAITKGSRIGESAGHQIVIPFDQVFDASGTSGHLNLIRGKNGALNQIETGLLSGPVHFKLVRHEVPGGGQKPSTNTYTGVADNVNMDLTSNPGTVTAKGHVRVDTDNDAVASYFMEDSFVFLVNDKLAATGLRFSGVPGRTTAKLKQTKL